MKPTQSREGLSAVLVAAMAILVLVPVGCDEASSDRLFQVSTLPVLMAGHYDGKTTLAALREQGDFGLGTFQALDGEMVMVEGKVYRVRADGKVSQVKGETRTPFACATRFQTDEKYSLSDGRTFQQLQSALDAWLPTTNLPYAIRITGTFRYVRTRSVPKQKKPYPPLAEVARTQPTFEFREVEGVMVGFRLPEYLAGVNLAGYHLHFLTKDRKGGGHVLEFTAREALIEVDDCREVLLLLPDATTFARRNFAGAGPEEIHAVEAGGGAKPAATRPAVSTPKKSLRRRR